jgi:hypothetical protein
MRFTSADDNPKRQGKKENTAGALTSGDDIDPPDAAFGPWGARMQSFHQLKREGNSRSHF